MIQWDAFSWRFLRVWNRNLVTFKKIWKVNFITPLLEPMFYILAFGSSGLNSNWQPHMSQAAFSSFSSSQRVIFALKQFGQAKLAKNSFNLDYFYSLADFYLKRKKLKQARSIAEQIIVRHPDQ